MPRRAARAAINRPLHPRTEDALAWTRAEAIPNGSSPGAMCIRMLTYDGEVSPVSESHTE
jgi:hypothetical protein